MKLNIRRLFINIVIPVILGGLVGIITSAGNNYNNLIQPVFAPPAFLFPIVWTILYILMGVSSYIITGCSNPLEGEALSLYILQLITNLFWSFIFFVFNWYFISFLWIILLIVLVILMIRKFFSISKVSAYIQIPYLLWLTYAAILNLAIFILNR